MLGGVVVSCAAAQDLPNLLVNPSFETVDDTGWATGWDIWPPKLPEAGAVSLDSTVAHTGQRSLRLRHGSFNSYTRGQQSLTLEPNQRYAFTVWVKGDNIVSGGGSMGARLYVEGIGGRDHASEAMRGTFDWQQLLVGPYSSGAGGRITVMCYLHLATGTVWWDDLQAFKVTPQWERQKEQERLQAGLEAQVRLAEDAARQAGDQTALDELAALRKRAGGVELAPATDFRHGPPYNDLDAEIYRLMARLNARRLPAQGPVVAWAADPCAPVPPLGLVPQQRALSSALLAGMDEREQAAIVLCNLGDKPLQAQVTVTGFPPQSPRLTMRESVHVETHGGRLVADPLPRMRKDRLENTYLMDLPPGVFRQLWCDLSTAGCKPGGYSGKVQISVPGRPPLVCPINLRVVRATFPQMAPIATWGYSYPTWPILQGRWQQAADDLAAHHINSYCWPSNMIPWPTFDAAGKLQPLDWTTFDQAVASHGPIRWLLLWPGFDWPANVKLRQDLEPGTPLWEERFVAWFRAMIAGLKQRGFGYDRVAWYLRDEPTTMTTAQVVALTGAAVHKADPKALIVENPYHAATQAMLDVMAPVVDIWCPMLSWPQGDLLKWFQDQSRKSGILWTYQVLSKDSDAFAAYRVSFWDCWRKGMSGQGFWDYADTAGEPDNWAPYPTNGTRYSVVYNGDPEELIPSRRWEAWREGTEDYTVLWLLKQKRPESKLLGDGVEALMARPTPEALAELRGQVLRELDRLVAGG
jgi:hypothetical protein